MSSDALTILAPEPFGHAEARPGSPCQLLASSLERESA
jgi:hypothetical protein